MAPKSNKKKYSINNLYKDYINSLWIWRNRRINGHDVVIRVPIPFKTFKTVIHAYFDLKFEELMRFGAKTDIEVSLISGNFRFRKYIQTRAFHTVKDNEESFKQGKLVKKKIPILEDEYIKVLWSLKKPSFGKLRVVFAESVRRNKIKLTKELGLDIFKMHTLK